MKEDLCVKLCLKIKGWPVVMLDVDSKQSESALRGPPPPFVTMDFIKALNSIIHPKGMYHQGFIICNTKYNELVVSHIG